MATARPEVIVADDDPAIRVMLRRMLATLGYKVRDLKSPGKAIAAIEGQSADLLILGLDAPDPEVGDLVRLVRQRSQVPVVVLSGRPDEKSIVAAFECGADEFVAKPFNSRELLARIENTLRRRARADGKPTLIVTGDLQIDLLHHRVQSRGQIVRLSVKKYEVLRALAENVDRPVTKAHLLRVVWGERGLDRLAYLRVAIRDLRRQIEDDPSHPRYIVTEPGIGYRLAVNLS